MQPQLGTRPQFRSNWQKLFRLFNVMNNSWIINQFEAFSSWNATPVTLKLQSRNATPSC